MGIKGENIIWIIVPVIALNSLLWGILLLDHVIGRVPAVMPLPVPLTFYFTVAEGGYQTLTLEPGQEARSQAIELEEGDKISVQLHINLRYEGLVNGEKVLNLFLRKVWHERVLEIADYHELYRVPKLFWREVFMDLPARVYVLQPYPDEYHIHLSYFVEETGQYRIVIQNRCTVQRMRARVIYNITPETMPTAMIMPWAKRSQSSPATELNQENS
jgi:hypothetical protein